MDVGEKWVYRERDSAPSQPVRILSFEQRKTSRRVSIEFLDRDQSGAIENVPSGRLRCLWSEVESYDHRMANWQRIGVDKLTDAEEIAMLVAFELLIPAEVADSTLGYTPNATNICDVAELERITQMSVRSFTDAVPSFQDGDEWWLSPEGSLAIAEAACRVNPTPVVNWVTAEERRCRDACKRGAPRTGLEREKYTSSPEWEYAAYLETKRPVHEILRQWCGHRAVSFLERLEAAEAEVHRLDELIARAADTFRSNKLDHHADWLDEEHERDRITPYTVRPIVERPLHPREIPMHVVYRKGWWHG